MVTPRQLFRQVLVWAACMAAINLFVAHLTRNASGRLQARNIRNAPPCTDLFLGHSLIAGGIDTRTYDALRTGGRALNLGMNATSPVEHYLFLRQASNQSPARLYYGFMNDQLTHPPEVDPLSGLVRNRAMVYAVDTDVGIPMYAGTNPVRLLGMRLTASIPVLREQSALWAKVEPWRRRLGAVGMPKTRTNRFGKVAEMAALAPLDPEQFASELGLAVNGHAPLSPPIRAIFGWAARRGTRFYAILMPVTTRHRAKYYSSPEWKAYRDYLVARIGDAGGVFIGAEASMSDDRFEDAIHLSPSGAREFTARLASVVPR